VREERGLFSLSKSGWIWNNMPPARVWVYRKREAPRPKLMARHIPPHPKRIPCQLSNLLVFSGSIRQGSHNTKLATDGCHHGAATLARMSRKFRWRITLRPFSIRIGNGKTACRNPSPILAR
jgi:hypothetical protein